MANNRLYIVDTETEEYICIAKKSGFPGWIAGNLDLYVDFMYNRNSATDEGTTLLIGTEGDDDFCNKWIRNGLNFNEENKWE